MTKRRILSPRTCDILASDKAEHDRNAEYLPLKQEFENLLQEVALPRSNSGRELEADIIIMSAPYVAEMTEGLAVALHRMQDVAVRPERKTLELTSNQDLAAGLDSVLRELVPRGQLQESPSARRDRWKDYVLFKYLSQVTSGYRGILVKAPLRQTPHVATVRAEVVANAFACLPANVGMLFETQRSRCLVAPSDLESWKIPKYPGKREANPIAFFKEVYGGLVRQQVLALNELRSYDERLVKAIYRECEEQEKDPEEVLPPNRARLTAINAAGIGKRAETTFRSHAYAKWRGANASAAVS